MKRKTVYTLVVIAVILSFFVTPVGHWSKILLNRVFATAPAIVPVDERTQITDYNWKLKDANWDYFNFEKSKGKVVFVYFWASWRLPCEAELAGIQKLYHTYSDRVDFYLVTNEEREPVHIFMEETEFDFPVTYLIMEEKTPFAHAVPPSTYILDKDGSIVIEQEGIADWDNSKVKALLEQLVE